MRQDEAIRDVSALLRARNTLLWITSGEELRVERALIAVAQADKRNIRFWDCAKGFTDGTNKVLNAVTDPLAALEYVEGNKERALFVFRDLNEFMTQDAYVRRALRSLGRTLQGTAYGDARAIIVLSASAEIPPSLEAQVTVLNWPLPDRDEMGALLDDVVLSLSDKDRPGAEAHLAENGNREAAVDAAVGLSAEEAMSSYAKSLVQSKVIDPAIVAAEKKRVIAKDGVLQWYDPDPRGLASVGGLDLLKEWLVLREVAFSAAAREYGLPAPKGVLLLGPPGTGKSLTAKCIASAWGLPLLRMDIGALRSKYVGDSEANIRRALEKAEKVSPCILWIDEIEKALAGATGPQGDGGVSADALGAILSWMQERKGSVFVVATANNVEALPPELIRRFDETFFINLPNSTERREVVNATLRKYGRDPDVILKDEVKVEDIIRSTDKFTGAEIDKVIPDALFRSFSDGQRELTADDILAAAAVVTPLASTAGDRITALQVWAEGKTRPASSADDAGAETRRGIEL
jgi:ATPase family associated with various cellular activities (AAA)